MEMKTSADWAIEYGVVVLNPDGWNRKNFEFSFNEELISRDEFTKRISTSTIKIKTFDQYHKMFNNIAQ